MREGGLNRQRQYPEPRFLISVLVLLGERLRWGEPAVGFLSKWQALVPKGQEIMGRVSSLGYSSTLKRKLQIKVSIFFSIIPM